MDLLTGAGSTRRWRELRPFIFERDGYVCQVRLRCDGDPATHVDHIVSRRHWPPGLPGVDDPANLQAACAECNLAKGAGATLRSWSW